MTRDSFGFLDRWTDLLPPAPPARSRAVVAIAGSGGCTTVLLRLLRHYRDLDARVLVTQTGRHAVPFDLRDRVVPADGPSVASALDASGVAFAAATGESELVEGLSPSTIEELAERGSAEVVLVQTQDAIGIPLRATDSAAPRWPGSTQLAIVVGGLAVVGRPWGPRTVEGADETSIDANGDPRRVRTEDVVEMVSAILSTVPEHARPLPMFTGFGAYRDLDGMFELVSTLWNPPRLPVVGLAEMLGDERRDAADRVGLPEALETVADRGERVYAVYPRYLDEEG